MQNYSSGMHNCNLNQWDQGALFFHEKEQAVQNLKEGVQIRYQINENARGRIC